MNYPKLAPKAVLASAGEDGAHPGQGPSAAPHPLRRIPYACTACKKAKTKCSGLPGPCVRCQKVGGSCVFDEASDQRRRVAAKRVADDLHDQQELWNQLLFTIGQSDQDELLELQNLVRRGATSHTIRSFIQNKLGSLEAKGAGHEGTAHTLRYAEAGIDQIEQGVKSGQPDLKRQITSSDSGNSDEGIRQIATKTASSDRQSSSGAARRRSDIMAVSNICDMPLFRVPVDSWTDVIEEDDDFISQLVSIYFTWLNPVWRLLDQDVYLQSMKNPEQSGAYCSPLLVHALLAIASHFSSDPGVFSDRRNPMSRGARFQQKALALWAKDDGKPSLANIQALSMLALDAIYRGQFDTGRDMLLTIKDMHHKLALHADPSESHINASEDKKTFFKVWRTVSWSIFNIGSFLSLVLQEAPHFEVPTTTRPCEETSLYLTMNWREYPGHRSSRNLKINLAASAICDLMEISRFAAAQLSEASPADQQSEQNSGDITAQFDAWEQDLSSALQWGPISAPCIFELHAIKAYVQVRIYSMLFARQGDPGRDGAISPYVQDLQHQTRRIIHDVASLIAVYRDEFSFERITLHMVAVSHLSCCMLLDYNLANDPVSSGAFVTLFQCLFAAGHRYFIGRILAHDVLMNAKSKSKRIPQQVVDIVNAGINVDSSDLGAADEAEKAALQQSWLPKDPSKSISFFPAAHGEQSPSDAGSPDQEDIENLGLRELLEKWDGLGLGGTGQV